MCFGGSMIARVCGERFRSKNDVWWRNKKCRRRGSVFEEEIWLKTKCFGKGKKSC
jgi:hypothetical protein